MIHGSLTYPHLTTRYYLIILKVVKLVKNSISKYKSDEALYKEF